MQVCTLFQTDSHTGTPPLFFYRPDALPATQTNSVKAMKACQTECNTIFSKSTRFAVVSLLWFLLAVFFIGKQWAMHTHHPPVWIRH